METNKISLKQMMGTKDVVVYLEDLIKSFIAGKVVVQQGEKYVDLQTPEMVDIKVEAKVKKDKSKFSLELSWHTMSSETDETVTISSKAPTKPAPGAKTDSALKAAEKTTPPPAPLSADDEEEVFFGPGSRKKKRTETKQAAAKDKPKAKVDKPAAKATPKIKRPATSTQEAAKK
jgi:amphi-Trp domain-containing protein